MASEKDGALLQLQLQQGRASLQAAANFGAQLQSSATGVASMQPTVTPYNARAQDRRVFRNISKPGYISDGPQPGAFSSPEPIRPQQAAVTPIRQAPPPPGMDEIGQMDEEEAQGLEDPNGTSGSRPPSYWWQKLPLMGSLDKQSCRWAALFVTFLAVIVVGVSVPVAVSRTQDDISLPTTSAPTISAAPTTSPVPSESPSVSPARSNPPTHAPTLSSAPSFSPTQSPAPTNSPSNAPTSAPTNSPSTTPTISSAPSWFPSISAAPTTSPSSSPTRDDPGVREHVLSLLPNHTVQTLQKDPNSPQAQALEYAILDSLSSEDSPKDWQVVQRFALASLYYATNGGKWTHNDGWLDHKVSECDWFFHSTNLEFQGQKCSCHPKVYTERIQRLQLFGNNLIGTLPPELFLLTDLEKLDLNSNSLIGSLPTEIGRLTNLELFTANENGFVGQLPRQLGSLSKLTELSLRNNRFTGSIPSRISRLRDLVKFDVTSNNLRGEVPNGLCHIIEFDCKDQFGLGGLEFDDRNDFLCGCSCECF